MDRTFHLPGIRLTISLCHFLLLWLQDPIAVLLEMKRVTRPGGAILILAEPDYTHRIDFPDELAILENYKANSLVKTGRKSRHWAFYWNLNAPVRNPG